MTSEADLSDIRDLPPAYALETLLSPMFWKEFRGARNLTDIGSRFKLHQDFASGLRARNLANVLNEIRGARFLGDIGSRFK